jgi:NAD(P)-dependent dehydrogenase (short-subunit alcohol dehydrogenase family)
MDLKGKVAIVPGGGTGMGKTIAELLAPAGAHVVVSYARSAATAIAIAQDLDPLTGRRCRSRRTSRRWPRSHPWSSRPNRSSAVLTCW